ncbi:MAG TPA: phenylacetic acid degradation protein PaaN [Herbaspirillum sp.]|jgi:phenylacetic acid degradation protein paaN
MHGFFERHQALLQRAVQAIAERGYWSPFSEMPSPRVYGETAADEGKAAFEARLNKNFPVPAPLPGAAAAVYTGDEISPFGFKLGVRYPTADLDALLHRVAAAAVDWRRAGPEVWAGVSLEILDRLNKRSFEMAHAVMHTTGQAFMMAFQAGGPHAQDRALEAIAAAWDEIGRIPKTADWEKPQGKNAPLKMRKTYRIVPRGIGLVIGCSTFPTWNGYPGLFADLATGNAVVVKPHPSAILPLAITVEIARDVLAEAGFDPDIVSLAAHPAGDTTATALALHPAIRLIDFTGSSANGNWLERNALQASVFTEKSGVNQIVIDSTADFKGMIRNIAFSLVLYSGQMCTAPQNIYIPKDGIDTPEGHVGFDGVVAALAEGIDKLTGDPAKAVELLGAIQNTAVLDRIKAARKLGETALDSRPLAHPIFPDARVHTPLLVKIGAADAASMPSIPMTQEFFGPISFAIATGSTADSIAIAERTAREHGAITLSAYTTDAAVKEQLREAAATAGVALSLNLTGAVFVNQSAAFSDYHGTGANPSANAALTDAAFIASRFRIVQTREHQ